MALPRALRPLPVLLVVLLILGSCALWPWSSSSNIFPGGGTDTALARTLRDGKLGALVAHRVPLDLSSLYREPPPSAEAETGSLHVPVGGQPFQPPESPRKPEPVPAVILDDSGLRPRPKRRAPKPKAPMPPDRPLKKGVD